MGDKLRERAPESGLIGGVCQRHDRQRGIRNASRVALQECDREVLHRLAQIPVETPHRTEVDECRRAVGVDDDVSRMQVGMKDAVDHELAQEAAQHRAQGILDRIGLTLPPQGGNRLPVDELHREDAIGGQIGEDPRDAHLVACRFRRLGETFEVARLAREIGLIAQVLGVLLRDVERTELAGLLDPARSPARQAQHDVDVAVQQGTDAGTLHLHGHDGAVIQRRPVDLGDGCRGQRLHVEAGESAAALAEFALEEFFDLRGRSGVDFLLQAREFANPFGRQDVVACREELPGLDEAATCFFERFAKPPCLARTKIGSRRVIAEVELAEGEEAVAPGQTPDLPEPGATLPPGQGLLARRRSGEVRKPRWRKQRRAHGSILPCLAVPRVIRVTVGR